MWELRAIYCEIDSTAVFLEKPSNYTKLEYIHFIVMNFMIIATLYLLIFKSA